MFTFYLSTALSVATELWTVDRRLLNVAIELGLAYEPGGSE